MIYTFNKLPELRRKLKNRKTVFVSGCFDILHEGHVQFLNEAAKHGNVLIVGIMSDKYIRLKKKRRPVHSQFCRANIISALKPVDYVILTPYVMSPFPSIEVLRTLRPKIFFRQEKTHMYEPIKNELGSLGITLKAYPMRKVNSTSKIIQLISKGLKS